MPGVRLELVQLTTPGLPATQYVPETLRFRLSTIYRRHKEILAVRELSHILGYNDKLWALKKKNGFGALGKFKR